VLLVFGLGYVGGERTREGLAYVVTGSVVISLTTMGVTMLAQTPSTPVGANCASLAVATPLPTPTRRPG
jgi:hypothetical protein